ncbi:MAG: ABC transporter ATP-binding protein [Planctomycetes bacterium]|nr:ABC transporter ATP-binding protein [Planctomycetota bacterium]
MLSLQDVTKSYIEPGGGRLPILDIASFHVAAGEQMALIGRSGCGKSTLLYVIAGITTADAGKIVIDGVDVGGLSEVGRDRLRADKIGYVFQTFNLLPAYSALENVLLGMTFSRGRADPARAKNLLERVGLSHRMAHKPGQLSVGEQQRVAVARALANTPKLVLADEPTANVDAGHQQQIVDMIRQTCAEEHVALVLVTHASEVAEQFDRVDHLEEFNGAVALA